MAFSKQPIIDASLVHRLITKQFPEFKDLSVHPATPGGHDNKTFYLGKDMIVRMPSAAKYTSQVEKEQKWLSKLAPLLPVPIPVPLAIGAASREYPWRWSIYYRIEGEPASIASIQNLSEFAQDLGEFLRSLQSIDPTDGPLPSPENFYRGASLIHYDTEIQKALIVLKDKIDIHAAGKVWQTALATPYLKAPVWVHGDISLGNLLIQNGRLAGVIDFGQIAVGDPSCDLAIAFTFFKNQSREILQKSLSSDLGIFIRGRAWALWKALITAAGFTNPNNAESQRCWDILEEILS